MFNQKKKILDLLATMEEAINYCIDESKNSTSISAGLIKIINSIIDSFVGIEGIVDSAAEVDVNYYSEQFAAYLVEIVELCERDDIKQVSQILSKYIMDQFYIWKEEVLKQI